MAAARIPLPLMQGHLRLVCDRDETGRSVLREQSFSAPVHVGKSFQEGGCCLLNVVNPTAGLLAGDRIEWDVEVRSGARLVLSGPSASRAHTMENGRADFSQRFRVARGGWLEVNPSLFIPQRNAHYTQLTRIELEEGGGLFFLESLAPGRVASGEAFAFADLDWDTQIRRGGRLILKERYRLRPDDMSLQSLRKLWNPSYYASIVAIHPALDPARLPNRLAAGLEDSVMMGCSALREGGAMVKILSRTSPALRRAVEQAREIIYDEAGSVAPSLRR